MAYRNNLCLRHFGEWNWSGKGEPPPPPKIAEPAPARSDWTAEEKAIAVAEANAPGSVVKLVARKHGINHNKLRKWMREAARKGEAPPREEPIIMQTTAPETPAADPAPRAAKRCRFSAEQRAAIVAECDAPGAVFAEIARKHGVTGTALYDWRKRAIGKASPAPTPSCPRAGATDVSSASIELKLKNGAELRIARANPDLLRAVMDALMASPQSA
jgi:transposase-like protein